MAEIKKLFEVIAMEIEQKHKQLLYNHIIALHICCTFVALAVALKSLDLKIGATSIVNAGTYSSYFLLFVFLLLVEIMLFYILVKKDLFHKTNIYHYLVIPFYVGFPLLVAFIILIVAEDSSNLELILLLPILIAASLGKKKVTYLTTGIVIFLFFLLENFKYGHFEISYPNIIVIFIMILVGWFSASVADVESKTRKKLAFSERRVRDILNFLPDATFTLDNNGRIIFWNRAMEKVSKIKAQEILGDYALKCSEIFFGERIPGIGYYIINPAALADNTNKNFSYIKEKKTFY